MKHNIGYINLQQKEQENETYPMTISSSETQDKKLKNNVKLQEKVYLNIIFYIWFFSSLFIILVYILYLKYRENVKVYSKIEDRFNIAFILNSFVNYNVEKNFFNLANKFAEKYNIYIIANKSISFNYKFDKRITKIVPDEYFSLTDFDKSSNIEFYILYNNLNRTEIKIYKSLNGKKKVIGIFEEEFFSYIYHNTTFKYNYFKNTLLYHSFIHFVADDYYIYNNLGIKNSFYIPNLYSFNPAKRSNSNLTYNNVLMIIQDINHIKESIYGIKAMNIIEKSIPNSKFYVITPQNKTQTLNNLIKESQIPKNIEFINNISNLQKYYQNCSVMLVPSLVDSWSSIIRRAKSYSVPIVAFNLSYIPQYQNGIIAVDVLDYQQMAQEVIKLLSDYKYRRIKGLEGKISLTEYNDIDTMNKWEKLFRILKSGNKVELRKFRNIIYKDVYDEIKAKERLESMFNLMIQINKNFACHSFKEMMDLNYIKEITNCKY